MGEPNRDLDAIARAYDPSTHTASFDWHLKRLQARAMNTWLAGSTLLELGCATGELAVLLSRHATAYTVIEAAAHNIEVTRARVPRADFVLGRWEDAELEATFSDVICSGVLEHAEVPATVLRRCHRWLEAGGYLHVCVPNGASLHRQAAVRLGMMDVPWELNDHDRAQGHWRNYTLDTILAELRDADWRVVHWEGIGVKPAPGSLMLEWDEQLIDALDEVGKQMGALCAELYLVCVPLV